MAKLSDVFVLREDPIRGKTETGMPKLDPAHEALVKETVEEIMRVLNMQADKGAAHLVEDVLRGLVSQIEEEPPAAVH